MKDIFTLCIAVILFGLCLIEKESRKKALESAISNQNAVENIQTSSSNENESFVMESDEMPDNKVILEEEAVSNTHPLFIQTTSFKSFLKDQ